MITNRAEIMYITVLNASKSITYSILICIDTYTNTYTQNILLHCTILLYILSLLFVLHYIELHYAYYAFLTAMILNDV